jgi:Ankyrin repeat
MTTSKSLPARPSLESLRKQAKKLSREIAAGNTDAITRARTQLPNAKLPLTQRDAQLVLAREYGFAGWQDLTAEANKRLGKGLEWAASQAHRIIHDNDVEQLKQLLLEYPALLSWRGQGDGEGGILGMATDSYGDSFDPFREQHFTRPACAELLIDAGAIVVPSVCDNLIRDRAKGLLQLFQRKVLLPHTLKFLAALGDLDGVRTFFEADSTDLATVNEAFMCACRFQHEAVASFLLDRSIALDPELGKHIDNDQGRSDFIKYLMEDSLTFTNAAPDGPWQAFLMNQVVRAIDDNALETFVDVLRRESWLLGDSNVGFQVGLIQQATLRDRGAFISALLDLNPALLQRRPPPHSQAIEFAFTYVKPHLIPLLTRIWPIPDDLPHAAGMGDLDRVKRWFDESGKVALGDLTHHFPANSARTWMDLQWSAPSVQQVLDTSFAWAVMNRHFEVADFLLEHGADINTRWSSHEPASILHELAGLHENYEAMQYLIDRGIDMTIVDYRWGGTAEGWARYAAHNEKMAQWLATAKREREKVTR